MSAPRVLPTPRRNPNRRRIFVCSGCTLADARGWPEKHCHGAVHPCTCPCRDKRPS